MSAPRTRAGLRSDIPGTLDQQLAGAAAEGWTVAEMERAWKAFHPLAKQVATPDPAVRPDLP